MPDKALKARLARYEDRIPYGKYCATKEGDVIECLFLRVCCSSKSYWCPLTGNDSDLHLREDDKGILKHIATAYGKDNWVCSCPKYKEAL